MKMFLVRANCEYTLEVEASSADEAIAEANKIPKPEWSQAWCEDEAEEEEDDPMKEKERPREGHDLHRRPPC